MVSFIKKMNFKNFKTNILIISSAFDFKILNKIKYKRYILLIILLLLTSLYLFGFRIIKVFSNSDQNGIYLVLPFSQNYEYKLNNYIAFCLTTKTAETWAEKFGLPKSNICKLNGLPLVKHVCGLPNDTIQLGSDNYFYINNNKTSTFLSYKNTKINEVSWNTKIKIPENKYFLCGKNNNSYDSRYYGFIPKQNILTKVILLIPLPENHFLESK